MLKEYIRVSAETLVFIQAADGFHIIVRQLKVKDFGVFFYAMRTHRLGNGYYTVLQIPAKNNLSRCLSIFFSQLCQHRQIQPPVHEGTPGFQLNPVLLAIPVEFLLAEERMVFHLVYHWNHFTV